MKRTRGFSLAEFTVMLALFGLFSTTALAALNLALGHWRNVARKVDAAAACRFVTSTLSNELRQGVPNPAPGATGYKALSPAVNPTAMLVPNANAKTSTSLTFTEPNPATFNPLLDSFNPENPANYRRVRYYTSGAMVRREVLTYSAAGAVTNTTDSLVAAQDAVALSFTWLSSNTLAMEVTCTRGNDTAKLKTQVFVIGR